MREVRISLLVYSQYPSYSVLYLLYIYVLLFSIQILASYCLLRILVFEFQFGEVNVL